MQREREIGKSNQINKKKIESLKIKCSNSIFLFIYIFLLFIYYSFRPDNADHIIDVNRNQNNPFEYDQVNIICPNYSPTGTRTDQAETYIIYNVSLFFVVLF